MERFGYSNLKAFYRESSELMALLAAEQYGYKQDQQEEIAEQKAKAEENGR